MNYTLKIFSAEDVAPLEREQAARRFRAALEEGLGGPALVWPVYQLYQRLLHAHGEQARPWPISPAELVIVEQWEAAELAATQAAFGSERYMGDADFELTA